MTRTLLENVPPGVTMINSYGPTENTVDATNGIMDSASPEVRLTSINKPMPNVTCYVVDHDAPSPTLQPVGVWGELWLGGVQVARGYLNRPELTAERFVRNPWAETDPSGRGVAYRTGDRVRWCAPVDIGRMRRCTNQSHRACLCLGWADQALQACVCGAQWPITHVSSL